MPESAAKLQESRDRAWAENTRLRYLCLTFIPELRTKLIGNERPMDRLNYMLGMVDDRAATQAVHGDSFRGY